MRRWIPPSRSRPTCSRRITRRATSDEPHFDGEAGDIIPEVKTALDAFCAAGLMAAGQDYERGGMQLPCVVEKARRPTSRPPTSLLRPTPSSP
jgi:hypothetical protein